MSRDDETGADRPDDGDVDTDEGAAETRTVGGRGSDADADEADGSGDRQGGPGSADDTERGRFGGAVAQFRRRSRRQQLLRTGTFVTVVGFVVLLAVVPMGILGLAVNDSTTFTADAAAPTEATLSEMGYERTAADTVVVRRSISPAGQDRSIVVENRRRTHTRSVAVQNRSFDAGVFVTLSSPSITVAGSEQNPLAGMTSRELLNRFASDLDAASGDMTFERVGERDAVLVGQRTTVAEFRTTMTVEGENREFAVYVATARSEGDIVVAVGLHPTAFADERVSIMELFYDVEHPADGG